MAARGWGLWGVAGAAAGWMAGAALQLQQPAIATTVAHLAIAAVGLLLVVSARVWRVRGDRYAPSSPAGTALSLAALAGGLGAIAFAVAGLRAEARIAERLDAALEGRDILVTGVVAGLPQPGLTGTRFVLEVEAAAWPAGVPDAAPPRVPRRLSLAWHRGFDVDAMLAGPGVEIRAGERWRLPVRLRRPHGSLNPGGFDLELWLFERRIGATGYVRTPQGARDGVARRLDAAACCVVERLRQTVRDGIEARVADPAPAGVLAALAIGDQGAIERDDWDVFRVTGVAHLMSISGLHVTMLAWLAAAAIGALWRRHPRAPLWRPAPVVAMWGGLAVAAAYALLAGWGVPAQRTVYMLATVVALRSLGVRWPAPLVLAAAAVVVAALDPWALLQPGFWLSFVAVGLLMASTPQGRDDGVRAAAGAAPPGAAADGATGVDPHTAGRRAAGVLAAAARGGLRTQIVATVGLAPLSMVFFLQVSLVGFAATLVAIPVVTLVVTPLALLGMVLPVLWTPAAALVEALRTVLHAAAAVPGATWTAAAAPGWVAVVGLAGAFVAVLPLPARLRACGLALMLPLLAPAVPRPPAGAFEVVAVDVGQGSAVLVRTHGHLLVYDTGPRWSPEADAGDRIVLPLLRVRGERAIDRLVLSHRDADHVGGAASLLDGVAVRTMTSSLEEGHPLRSAGPPHERCEAGQRWRWDGVDFAVLHPPAEAYRTALRTNALSCVVRVEGGGRSLLLAGDIEAAQESALVAREGRALTSDALLVPHHGSRTSSTPAFIEAVAPRFALVQAGYRSRFGHPAPDVVARYEARGVQVVRSDTCGAWTWPADAPPRCERDVARRYWHHRPG